MLYLCGGSHGKSHPVLFLHDYAYTSGHREDLRTRVLYITMLGSLASHTLCRERNGLVMLQLTSCH